MGASQRRSQIYFLIMITFEKRELEEKINFPAFFKRKTTEDIFLFFDQCNAMCVTNNNDPYIKQGQCIKADFSCFVSAVWEQVHGRLVIEA